MISFNLSRETHRDETTTCGSTVGHKSATMGSTLIAFKDDTWAWLRSQPFIQQPDSPSGPGSC